MRPADGGDQLRHVLDHVPTDRVLGLLFEDLRDRPTDVYDEVFRFLGATPIDTRVEGRVANAYHEMRPTWLWHASLRYRLVRLIPRRPRQALYHWMRREPGYPPPRPADAQRMAAAVEDDVAQLADWIEGDLSAWTTLMDHLDERSPLRSKLRP